MSQINKPAKRFQSSRITLVYITAHFSTVMACMIGCCFSRIVLESNNKYLNQINSET